MAVEIKEVNGEELDALIGKGKVLVDFYSKTCGPCKMLSFVLKDIAKGIEDIEILTVDYDVNKEAVDRYGVIGYPTLVFLENGKEIERMKGLQQKPAILKMIKAG